MESKNVLIVGSGGQDGRILTEILLRDGFTVFGLTSTCLTKNKQLISNWTSWESDVMDGMVKESSPQFVFYLAAHHHSPTDPKQMFTDYGLLANRVHVQIYLSLLSSLLRIGADPKIFYASSRLIFDQSLTGPVNEEAPFRPVEPYGISKLSGTLLGTYYKETHGLEIYNAIFFNHDSEYRKKNFLLPTLIEAAIKAKRDKKFRKEIYDFRQEVDISSARDLMGALKRLAVEDVEAGDYIFGSGRTLSVEAIADIIFSTFGLRYQDWLYQSEKKLLRPSTRYYSDVSKLSRALGSFQCQSVGDWLPELVVNYTRLNYESSLCK